MIRDHDLRLLDAVYRYVRHRPDLFSEAARWLVFNYVESSPASGRKESGLRPTSSVESMIRDMAASVRAGCDASGSGQADRLADARRVLLVSWLLDERAHFDAAEIEEALDDARPPGLQGLPMLDDAEFLRLEVKYGLRSDPDWLATVRGAWQLAGDDRYLSKGAQQDVNDRPSQSVGRSRKLKPSQLRAAQSVQWLAEHHPELMPKGTQKYNREMHRFLLENDCPAYTAKDGRRLPVPRHFETWKRHVRAGLQHLPGPSDGAEAEPDPGRSIRRLGEV